jgi:acyl carrier protein
MMNKEDIIKTINGFLVEEFEIDESKISPDAHLKNDLGLESLDFVDIAVIVQKEFGLTLKGEEMTGIKNLQDLYDYIFNALQKK